MPAKLELTGQTFDRLYVNGPSVSKKRKGATYWHCTCICGSCKVINGSSLVSGNTRSCGCLKEETNKTVPKTHGMSNLPEYDVWQRMKQRCSPNISPESDDYTRYYLAGIRVCKRWEESFPAFLEDMGRRPGKGYSIERKDGKKGYEPSNCYWATATEQHNNKSNNQLLKHNGEIHTWAEWARMTGLPRNTIKKRTLMGWTAEKTLTTPKRQGNWRKSKKIQSNLDSNPRSQT